MSTLAETAPLPSPEPTDDSCPPTIGDHGDDQAQCADEACWDRASAEALTKLYERELAPGAFSAGEDRAVATGPYRPRWTRARESEQPDAEPAPRFEDRLAAIADRLEQSVTGLSSALSAEALALRLDTLEVRIGSLAQKTRSDVESQQALLARLDEFAAAHEDVRAQLERLPGLEGRLAETMTALFDSRQPPKPDPDSIASEVGRCLVALTPSKEDGELARVIADLAAERRETDGQVSAALDTMQQAMVSILDRLDAVAPDSPELDPIGPSVRAASHVPALISASRACCDEQAAAIDAQSPGVSSVEQDRRTMVERLRQEFIAGAQRAKLRAEAEAEHARSDELAKPAKPTDWLVARLRAGLAQGMPMKRVLVAALGAIIVLQAVSLLVRRADVAEPPPATNSPISSSQSTGALPDRARNFDQAIAGNADAVPDAEPSRTDSAELADERGGAIADAAVAGVAVPKAIARPTALHPEEAAALATNAGQRAARLPDLPPANVGPLSLRLAAANGNPSAEFEVGARLAEGKGLTQDLKAAARWYQRAASRGFAQAQYRLGTLYERGLGVPMDLARAGLWYRRAAEHGNVTAMHNYAVLSAGSAASAPGYATAARWFVEAAERGLADSQYNLAVLHENGLGVPKSTQLAYKWFALAARSGDAEAARRRDAIKAGLSEADLVAADESAAAWRAKPIDALANDARAAGEAWRKSAPEASG